jgi:heme/copper-type cytochrome/quinol oxidase subunit 2
MSRNQRLTFLGIAVVIAVAAVILFTAGAGDEEDAGTAAATATPRATATQEAAPGEEETAEPTATPRPKPPLVTGEGVKELDFKEGDTIRFRVRSSQAEEVHVHGYNIAKDVEPGQTVTFSFKATITGIFEVEYEHSGQQIAELKVEPR